jgi:hypothetical protein
MFDQLHLRCALRPSIERHHDILANNGPLNIETLTQAAMQDGYVAGVRSARERLAPRRGDAVSTVATMMDAFELML